MSVRTRKLCENRGAFENTTANLQTKNATEKKKFEDYHPFEKNPKIKVVRDVLLKPIVLIWILDVAIEKIQGTEIKMVLENKILAKIC